MPTLRPLKEMLLQDKPYELSSLQLFQPCMALCSMNAVSFTLPKTSRTCEMQSATDESRVLITCCGAVQAACRRYTTRSRQSQSGLPGFPARRGSSFSIARSQQRAGCILTIDLVIL